MTQFRSQTLVLVCRKCHLFCCHDNTVPAPTAEEGLWLTFDLSPRLPQISESLNLVRELLQQLTNQRASIKEDIHSNFEDLHKQLDVRKSVLLMELEVTYGLKQKVQLSNRLSPVPSWIPSATIKPVTCLNLV